VTVEIPIRKSVKKFPAIALLLIAGCAATGPVDEAVSRVSVTFVEPEIFTDARRAELGRLPREFCANWKDS
jgi:hypothetical protein